MNGQGFYDIQKSTPTFIPKSSITPKKALVTQQKPSLPKIMAKGSLIETAPHQKEDIILRNSLPSIPAQTEDNLIGNRSKIILMKPSALSSAAKTKTLEGKIEQKIKLRVPLFKQDLPMISSTLTLVDQEEHFGSRKFPTVIEKSPESISRVDFVSRDLLLQGKKSHRLIRKNEPLIEPVVRSLVI